MLTCSTSPQSRFRICFMMVWRPLKIWHKFTTASWWWGTSSYQLRWLWFPRLCLQVSRRRLSNSWWTISLCSIYSPSLLSLTFCTFSQSHPGPQIWYHRSWSNCSQTRVLEIWSSQAWSFLLRVFTPTTHRFFPFSMVASSAFLTTSWKPIQVKAALVCTTSAGKNSRSWNLSKNPEASPF